MMTKEEAQEFCAKAEAFVKFVEYKGLISFWKGEELWYFSQKRNDTTDIPSWKVYQKFVEEAE